MIRLVVATLLLAAIAVTVRLKAHGTGPARAIKVTARAAVNRGAVVAIVETEGRRLLIGAASNQVNVLADLGAVDPGLVESASLTSLTESNQGSVSSTKHPVRSVVATATTRPSTVVTSDVDGSLVHRLRRLTTRTADPSLRPNIVGALRQETRRHR